MHPHHSSKEECSTCSVSSLPSEAMPADQAYWNAAALFTGFGLIVVAYITVFDTRFSMGIIRQLSALDLVILSLATFRVIRLVTYDKIFAFVRDYFMDREDQNGVMILVKPKGGFRRMVAELMECMWCTGMWAALVIFTLYLSSPFGWFAAVILAMSAAGSFMQNVSRTIAHTSHKAD